MIDPSLTNTQLLNDLQDPANDRVWGQYVDRYRPFLIRYARRFNLSHDEAEDAAQQTLVAFSQAFRQGKYIRSHGRLRHWLFGIARNQILLLIRKRPDREVQVGGQSQAGDFFDRVGDEAEMKRVWDQDWRDTVIRRGLEQVRQEVDGRTMTAFQHFVQQDRPARDVARELGITENAVYCAKRRILRRLRELVATLEDEF